MTAAPLFVETLEDLKRGVRMSGATSSDTLAVLERAILDVRVGFYDRLGESRITQINETAYTTSPTTADELVRVKAANIEIAWVKLMLVRELPMLFLDSSGAVDQFWNEEGLTRDVSNAELRRLKEELETKVSNGLQELIDGVIDGNANVTVVEPNETPPRPGDSLWNTAYYGQNRGFTA